MDPFFDFFTQNRPYIDPDDSKWPREWSIIEFKSYPRFPKIRLPKPSLRNFRLKEAITKRRSIQRGSVGQFSAKILNLKQISDLLFYSAGITRPNKNLNKSRRAYPSGGARYPLEIYLALLTGPSTGIYHYNVLDHSLEEIINQKRYPNWDMEFKNAIRYEFARKANMIILITFTKKRSFIKYGNFAYKIALIEAGHIGQNVYLVSQALGLGCCSLGGFDEKIVNELLDIDGTEEIPFYAIAVGNTEIKSFKK